MYIKCKCHAAVCISPPRLRSLSSAAHPHQCHSVCSACSQNHPSPEPREAPNNCFCPSFSVLPHFVAFKGRLYSYLIYVVLQIYGPSSNSNYILLFFFFFSLPLRYCNAAPIPRAEGCFLRFLTASHYGRGLKNQPTAERKRASTAGCKWARLASL